MSAQQRRFIDVNVLLEMNLTNRWDVLDLINVLIEEI